ncbi:hypothetical protein D3C80_1908650 [compost metagenome]
MSTDTCSFDNSFSNAGSLLANISATGLAIGSICSTANSSPLDSVDDDSVFNSTGACSAASVVGTTVSVSVGIALDSIATSVSITTG